MSTAHQAPPSLGFSRQEHWRGVPFPSPMRESEVAQLCPTLYDPVNCSPPLSKEFYRQGCWSGFSFPTPGDLPHSGIKPMSPAWQVDFRTTEAPGKSTMECYSDIKKNKIILFAMTQSPSSVNALRTCRPCCAPPKSATQHRQPWPPCCPFTPTACLPRYRSCAPLDRLTEKSRTRSGKTM